MPKARALAPEVKLREVWAWSMYDFANSGYTTVVITAVFNAYFVAAVMGGGRWAELVWTSALSVSYLAVLLSAPLLGAWADAHAAKKRLLLAATVGCVAFTALLWFASPSTLVLTIVFLVASNFFFATGENLIAAFLPELADSKAMGRVSGWGWAFGYLGGIVALGICIAYVLSASAKGVSADVYVPVTMLITAVLFAVFATPTFIWLRERALPQAVAVSGAVREAWGRVHGTLRHAREYRDLRRFLLCILFYQAGIMAVITLAAIYATQVMKFSQAQTMILIFSVNFFAAAGAFGFGYLQDAIGHVRAMALVLAGWILMIALAYLAVEPTLFWIAAILAGICMGSAQAAGRAIVGYLAPPRRLAEFFGLWGLAVKAASIVGPPTYGLLKGIFEDHRVAVLAIGVYFVVGLFLLSGIDMERGRAAALRTENNSA